MQRHDPETSERDKLIGIVGPCAAGKSTLVTELRKQGYQARHIAQEHSFVPDMWRRVSKPDILIYLDVTFPVSMKRKKLNWNQDDFMKQVARLQHARQHANLYVDTDSLSTNEIKRIVFQFLERTT